MTIYLYFHAVAASFATWLLVRTVSCSNIVGVIAMITCAIFGPFALFALICGAFMSINHDMDARTTSAGSDHKILNDRRRH